MEMTKDKIVERLIREKHITPWEAVILLKELPTFQSIKQYPVDPVYGEPKVPFHTICGCNVCNCTMANNMVYPTDKVSWTTDCTYNQKKEQ